MMLTVLDATPPSGAIIGAAAGVCLILFLAAIAGVWMATHRMRRGGADAARLKRQLRFGYFAIAWEWIKTYPSLRSEHEYMARRRGQMWGPLKADPSALSQTARFFLGVLHQVLGANRAGAQARREIRRKGGALYQDVNRFTRWQMEMDWRLQLLQPTTPGAELNWLRPCLDLQVMFRPPWTDWQHFCATELDPGRVPMNYFSALIVHSQTGASIGDTLDRIHACHLLTFDRVVTADRRFFNTMQSARAVAPTPGIPVLIERRAASVAAELQRAIR